MFKMRLPRRVEKYHHILFKCMKKAFLCFYQNHNHNSNFQTMASYATFSFTQAIFADATVQLSLMMELGSTGNLVSQGFFRRSGIWENKIAHPCSVSWMDQERNMMVRSRYTELYSLETCYKGEYGVMQYLL